VTVSSYFVIATLGQALGGLCMAIGVIVGLRLALPSLARTLVREMDAARLGEAGRTADDAAGRPVVTLHPHHPQGEG
jgi:hypothetical protein